MDSNDILRTIPQTSGTQCQEGRENPDHHRHAHGPALWQGMVAAAKEMDIERP